MTRTLKGRSSVLPKELLRYGKILYDRNINDANGNYIRVRVFEYRNRKFVYTMYNGEQVDLIEI